MAYALDDLYRTDLISKGWWLTSLTKVGMSGREHVHSYIVKDEDVRRMFKEHLLASEAD